MWYTYFMKPLILSIDIGTTSTRVFAFNQSGQIIDREQHELTQIYPEPGWVEQDPLELVHVTCGLLNSIESRLGTTSIQSIGITNQRETTIIWDKRTGTPIYNAIVWQDRRTSHLCRDLAYHADVIKTKTGLFLDPYFSATKIKWILEKTNVSINHLAFGTVDSWILWHLTDRQVHATDLSNASRTMLVNLNTGAYDDELCSLFNIPHSILPDIKPSNSFFGYTASDIPITAILGDQQASLYAHGGTIKNTYGTGLFVAASTAETITKTNRLISTVAWQIDQHITYAVEGSIFTGGSIIQWLRDGLNLVHSASETEQLAASLSSHDGLYIVPALTGLGAPYWIPEATGLITGITPGITVAHFARAALESMAYQTADVLSEIPIPYAQLHVDGGATSNHFLMQFQADILNILVVKPAILETTALGVAMMAGLKVQPKSAQIFKPTMSSIERQERLDGWHSAMAKVLPPQ